MLPQIQLYIYYCLQCLNMNRDRKVKKKVEISSLCTEASSTPHGTVNLDILCCCLIEHGNEMYQNENLHVQGMWSL